MTLPIPPGDFRAYIFDCDGTLADTMPLHYQAWLKALGRLGCPFPEDLFYSLGGVPAAGVVEFLNARYGFAMPVAATAEYKEALFEKLIPQVQPVPEVIAFMESLGGRYPLAVASGGLKPIVLATLETLGIRQHFPVVVTCEDVVHGKPAPDTYLEAARQLGIDPAHCLVFEDTPLGIDSAVAAGMQTVLVVSGPAVGARP